MSIYEESTKFTLKNIGFVILVLAVIGLGYGYYTLMEDINSERAQEEYDAAIETAKEEGRIEGKNETMTEVTIGMNNEFNNTGRIVIPIVVQDEDGQQQIVNVSFMPEEYCVGDQ